MTSTSSTLLREKKNLKEKKNYRSWKLRLNLSQLSFFLIPVFSYTFSAHSILPPYLHLILFHPSFSIRVMRLTTIVLMGHYENNRRESSRDVADFASYNLKKKKNIYTYTYNTYTYTYIQYIYMMSFAVFFFLSYTPKYKRHEFYYHLF